MKIYDAFVLWEFEEKANEVFKMQTFTSYGFPEVNVVGRYVIEDLIPVR